MSIFPCDRCGWMSVHCTCVEYRRREAERASAPSASQLPARNPRARQANAQGQRPGTECQRPSLDETVIAVIRKAGRAA